jgi:hypothetical protein
MHTPMMPNFSQAQCLDTSRTEFPPEQQLIVEGYVKNLDASLAFFKHYEFEVVREEPHHFAELAWGINRLYLEQVDAKLESGPVAVNIRVMVPDVDRYFALAQSANHPLLRELSDKYYGLRDFTVSGPDGMGLRFASPISDAQQH